MAAPPVVAKGLDHVLIGRSTITWVGGETGDLVYRGFDVRDLVPGVPYESIVHLLLFGDPPARDPSPEVLAAVQAASGLPEPVARLADSLPRDLPPLEALRTLLSALGDGSYGYPPRTEEGFRLVARAPLLLARFVRRSKGEPWVEPDPGLGLVERFLEAVRGASPPAAHVRALEAYFDLLADHGMNASTFALRVAISTESDLISAATAALAVLKGPTHGGAPSRVSAMLDAIREPDRASAWIAERVRRREVLYGFGHRAYKTDDPRAVLLHAVARKVADPDRLALAEAVERVALEALRAAHPAARIYTNVEYYSAIVLEAVGLPPELFTPTFAVARTAGWAAHALEQAADNRLIRPDVLYDGPPKGRRWPNPRARE